jgi:thioredoxin reductase
VTEHCCRDRDIFDVAVVGGGPAGLAAAAWTARYRRRVVLVDGGEQRNRWTDATHGYLGHEDISPHDLLRRARSDLAKYPEVEMVDGVVTEACAVDGSFELRLDDGRELQAMRIVLATGVRDVFPAVEGFSEFYGSSVFTCPSCDGYEAQGRNVVIWGDNIDVSGFALGMLDWADSVTVLARLGSEGPDRETLDSLSAWGIHLVDGEPIALEGENRKLGGVRLRNHDVLSCDVLFCAVPHVQHSPLADRLGCEISAEGCVVVDDQGRTNVPGVFAAGDMTPGPHLVQIAAAKGAVAGIAASVSIRGERGAPRSPTPAPDAASLLAG